MKLKSAIATFLVILTGTCIVPFLTPYREGDSKSNVSDQKPQIETNQATNATSIATNKIDRALDNNNKPAQNMDWFIQGSNYIWDEWKIK